METSAVSGSSGAGRRQRWTPRSPRGFSATRERPPVIALADADADARLEIATVLREDDMVVLEAEDVHALARAAEQGFDLAVVDADLPGASLLRGAGLDARVPVVVVARAAGPLTDAVASALGAIGVLRKPVDEDDLRTIVWNLC